MGQEACPALSPQPPLEVRSLPKRLHLSLVQTLFYKYDEVCHLEFYRHNQHDIKLYKLEEAGKGINIRHYNIEINDFGETSLRLTMLSSYFTGNGKELDY